MVGWWDGGMVGWWDSGEESTWSHVSHSGLDAAVEQQRKEHELERREKGNGSECSERNALKFLLFAPMPWDFESRLRTH